MKLDVWVVSSRMPSDARGMGGVSTGGGTMGSVQLNCTGCGEGNWVVVGVCNTDCEMRSDCSWSMGGLVGSPKTVGAGIYQAMGQVVPVPGTVAKGGRALYRTNPAGDGEADIGVRRLGLDLGDDHGKASDHCGCRSV